MASEGHGAAAPHTLSAKAERTREALLDAARTVFEREGFLNARVTDITTVARVAHGTFYTYFPSKEAIFRELVLRVQDDLAASNSGPADGPPAERIWQANRAYVDAYLRNGAILCAFEQAATIHPGIRQLRREVRRPYVERSVRSIRRWQAQGIADPVLDAVYTANALGAMVDRFMYTWVSLDEDFERDLAVTTLTRLWVQALGIRPSEEAVEEWILAGDGGRPV